jgi:hypothetical protein
MMRKKCQFGMSGPFLEPRAPANGVMVVYAHFARNERGNSVTRTPGTFSLEHFRVYREDERKEVE